MGWYFTRDATRDDVVVELTEEELRTGFRTLAQRVVGNVLWTVHERADGETPRTWIGCYLLEKGGDGWGYKPMDESMGPFYYSCPLAFLTQAPEQNPAWREKVRAWHADRKRGAA